MLVQSRAGGSSVPGVQSCIEGSDWYRELEKTEAAEDLDDEPEEEANEEFDDEEPCEDEDLESEPQAEYDDGHDDDKEYDDEDEDQSRQENPWPPLRASAF